MHTTPKRANEVKYGDKLVYANTTLTVVGASRMPENQNQIEFICDRPNGDRCRVYSDSLHMVNVAGY